MMSVLTAGRGCGTQTNGKAIKIKRDIKKGRRRETVTLIEVDFQNKYKFLLNLLKVGLDNEWGIPCADRLASLS